jgi:hypothetical protein
MRKYNLSASIIRQKNGLTDTVRFAKQPSFPEKTVMLSISFVPFSNLTSQFCMALPDPSIDLQIASGNEQKRFTPIARCITFATCSSYPSFSCLSR